MAFEGSRLLARFLVSCAVAASAMVAPTAGASGSGTTGFGAKVARAATPPSPGTVPVYVLGIDSDDAEDQAEALTSALRSRVRLTPSWTLSETSQTSGTLFLALRCPPRPDAPCLQRVGDQLKADRFIWGSMSQAGPSQVTAEVHLWTRGRAETVARETYSSNLQDAGEESLRRVAIKIIEKLSGVIASSVLVQASTLTGTVMVDGKPLAELDHGQARLVLPAGAHTIEVRSPGHTSTQQRVDAPAGGEAEASFRLVSTAAEGAERRGVSAQRVLGWTAIGVGAVGVGVGVVQGARFLSLNSELNGLRRDVPSEVTDVCSEQAQAIPAAVFACRKAKEVRQTRDLGLVFAGAGLAVVAVGMVLLVTDTEPKAKTETRAANTWSLTPRVSPWTGGVDVRVSF